MITLRQKLNPFPERLSSVHTDMNNTPARAIPTGMNEPPMRQWRLLKPPMALAQSLGTCAGRQ